MVCHVWVELLLSSMEDRNSCPSTRCTVFAGQKGSMASKMQVASEQTKWHLQPRSRTEIWLQLIVSFLVSRMYLPPLHFEPGVC